jgi:all-trans-8'-apo-beta-carotenal 15,15'-oxygenase
MDEKAKSRRLFLSGAGSTLSYLMLLSPLELIQNQAWAQSQNGPIDRLSWKANRGTTREGAWAPQEIEGALPADLAGTLYRVGPGLKRNHDITLKHFFDGDAYLTSLQMKNGKITAQSKYLQTFERSEEQRLNKMLYFDFGTAPGVASRGYKNNPNINVFPMGNQMLALSEAGWPTVFDPDNLESAGLSSLGGGLRKNVFFTAHPKRDPESGDLFGFGIEVGPFPKLKVYQIPKAATKAIELYSFDMGGFFSIHDMMITENHIVFLIPPLKIDVMGAVLKRGPIANLLRFQPNDPFRIVVFRKDGKGEPLVLDSAPGGVAFHHCNAYEDSSGNIVFHSVLIDDASVYKVFSTWGADQMAPSPLSWLTRFEIDLKDRRLLSREKMSSGVPLEFPAVDPRLVGQWARYMYAIESDTHSLDPLAFTGLVCWDLEKNSVYRIQADSGQAFGEPLFIAKPNSFKGALDSGWIVHLGYDSKRDETFLDVRESFDLKLISRVWMGHYFPLGFHGHFLPNAL